MSTQFHIGVGGWVFPDWRGTIYPKGLPQSKELEHLSRRLTAIEVNGTYYGSQKPATFQSWAAQVPDGFIFPLKGTRFATNRKDLGLAGDSVARFVDSGIDRLGDRLGPINWQLAATKRFNADEVDAFLSLLPPEVGGLRLRHVIEARHESFCDPAYIALLRKHGVATVIAGDAEFPVIPDATADFAYLRIMGTSADHPAGYSDAALDLWAARVRALAAGEAAEGLPTVATDVSGPKPAQVFVFVIRGEKVRNPLAAEALIARLSDDAGRG